MRNWFPEEDHLSSVSRQSGDETMAATGADGQMAAAGQLPLFL